MLLCILLLGAVAHAETLCMAALGRPRLLRREILAAGSAAVLFRPLRVLAEEPILAGAITDKVHLDINIGGKPCGKLVVGLLGKDAPLATENFLRVVKGSYRGDISYDGSTLPKVVRGKEIVFGKLSLGRDKYETRAVDFTGRVRRTTRNAAEDFQAEESNGLKHDRPGMVSVHRGGGTFEFTIAPQPNPSLDAENVVFGQVLSGWDVLQQIEEVPVSREDPLGSKQRFAEAGKSFDPRAKLASISRPLQKIVITEAGTL